MSAPQRSAASAVHAVLAETHRTNPREIRLVSAQNSIVEPPQRFEASPLGRVANRLSTQRPRWPR